MKNIYTYSGKPATRNLTVDCLRKNKTTEEALWLLDVMRRFKQL